MKRGLIRLDPAELTADELDRRVRVLQARLRAAGVAAALVYGDVSRSGDVAYLTNLCIYWNEGVLAVPAEGEPAFLTKLSARVQPWMRATSSVRDLRSGPDLAGLIGDWLAEAGPGPVGVVARAWWPAPLLERFGGREPRDLGDLVRDQRLGPDESELALLRRAARVAGAAVAAAAAGDGVARNERLARAELAGRGSGATDLLIDCDPGPDGGVALEVRAQVLDCWALAARTVPDQPALATAYGAAVTGLRAGVSRSRMRGTAPGWHVDVLRHPDLETRGDHRPPEDLDAPFRAGEVAALRVSGGGPDGGRVVAAGTYVITEGGIELCAS